MDFREIALSDISIEKKDLLKDAFKVMRNAYNPYSGFCVGSAVKTSKGMIFSAANFENASYGLSLCAEAGALQSAISAGEHEIIMIAIVSGDDKNLSDEIALPCGRCRQLIQECSNISKTDIEIVCANKNMSKVIDTKISKLLPLPFSSSHLLGDEKMDKYRTGNKDNRKTSVG